MDVDLDEVQWRWPEWIREAGLSSTNALDYFAQSPFWDRTSNNQVLKMQRFADQGGVNPDPASELKQMVGTEFIIAYTNDVDMWVIRKQQRYSPTEADILSTYFILGDNIYKAPSVHAVLASRLLAVSYSMQEALKAAERVPTFSSGGYSRGLGRILSAGSSTSKDGSDKEKSDDALAEVSEENAIAMERALLASLNSTKSPLK